MGANDPIGGVSVGLGKRPGPLLTAKSGTSTAYFDGQHLNAFLAAKNQGRMLWELNVHHSDWFHPNAQVAVTKSLSNIKNNMTVFPNVRVTGARLTSTGWVEVSFQHGAVQQLAGASATARAVATKGVSGM